MISSISFFYEKFFLYFRWMTSAQCSICRVKYGRHSFIFHSFFQSFEVKSKAFHVKQLIFLSPSLHSYMMCFARVCYCVCRRTILMFFFNICSWRKYVKMIRWADYEHICIEPLLWITRIGRFIQKHYGTKWQTAEIRKILVMNWKWKLQAVWCTQTIFLL